MKKAKLQAAALGGTPDDIEQAFYEALHNADIQQLMVCWAEEDEIVCVHPGGPRLIGAGAIGQAFEAMFSNGSVQAFPERIHKIESLASAVHHLVERVDVLTPQGQQTAWVLTTNVYHKTPQGWRMVAHHTSPGTPHDVPDQGHQTPVLH
jgi:ketosteroid isomerase-like protein